MTLSSTRQLRWPAWMLLAFALCLPLNPLVAAPAPGVPRTQGAQDAAVAPSQYPVLTAGTDGSVIRTLRTDTSGRLVLGTSVGTQMVEGEIADGAAATTNLPVNVGGVDGSGNIQQLRVDTSGGAIVNIGGGSAATDAAAIANFVGVLNAAGTGRQGLNVLPSVSNGTTADIIRSATAVDGTAVATGTGVQSAGIVGTDGTNYQTIQVDTNGTLRTGRNRIQIQSTPTVGVASAYAAGDVIGVINTLSNAVRVTGGSGIIRSVTVSSKTGVADIAVALRVWFFNANPSGSTFTDNAALNIVDADITKVIGFVDLPGTGGAATSGEVWSARACDLQITTTGTSIFAVIESRGAVTQPTGTTDFQLTTLIEQD